MSITKRTDKGSALTYDEMDDNFDAIAPRTSATGSIQIPAGDTNARDATPSAGFLRYNTSLNSFEGYQNGAWGNLGAGGGGGGGDVNQNAFSIFSVSGQTSVSADSATDTVEFIAGSNITLTTNSGSDSITIAASGLTQDFAYSSLTDVPSSFPPSTHNQAWSTITGTPTTLAGYGITDGGSGGGGVQGFTGIQGFTGQTGGDGDPGAQGTNGIGLSGNQGIQGPAGGGSGGGGAQGLQGTQGFQGTIGQTGFGSDGAQGFQGLQGDEGPEGNAVQGIQGPSAPAGATVQGTQGVQGSLGFDGQPGFQGMQGLDAAGIQGVQGLNGPAGFGLQGHQGIQGDLGPEGPEGEGAQGIQGADGFQGLIGGDGGDGPDGVQGLQGPAGSVQGLQGTIGVGDTGAQGIQGSVLQGTIGTDGVQGIQGLLGTGVQGLQGEAVPGPNGLQGATGIQGLGGDDGIQGTGGVSIQGIQGTQGIIGETGTQGTQGIQGLQSVQGLQGLQGEILQGVQGSEGTIGLQGVQGNQSTQGIQGNAGIGIQGPSDGVQGLQGTTGDAGVQGPSDGQTGAQGLLGPQGIQGLTAQGVNGVQGFVGIQGPSDGADGIQGTTGIQGSQGTQGLTGAGVQGTTGNTGVQGPADGPQGTQGVIGTAVQGIQGSTDGPIGPQGTQGVLGLQGLTGSTGLQGVQGLTGSTGLQGIQGVQGMQGLDGPEGKRSFVVAANGSTDYVIDGVNDPTINLIRGFTYAFNVAATGHPFEIRASNGGSAYNTGVINNAAQNGTVLFTVPYNAPATLYYQCTVHSNMGGVINTSDLGPTGVQGLTGLQGVQGLQSVQGIQGTNGDISTMLPLAGGTMTGNILHGDNIKATYGTGNDLEIYHDGSHSRIVDTGTGNLKIQAQNFAVNNVADDENMITAEPDGFVKLFYNGSEKLATTSTGATVTGKVVSNSLDVNGLTTLASTGESGPHTYRSGNSGNDFRFYSTNGTIASPTAKTDGSAVGQIHYSGHDGTAYRQNASIAVTVDGAVSTGTVPMRMTFHAGTTTNTERMRIHSGGVVSIPGGIELGSGLDATAANTLDDYEEGTFTPTFTSSGTAPSLTYTTQGGTYVKVGNLVTIWIKLRINTISSAGSGNLRVGGLPFTVTDACAETGGSVGLWLSMATATGTEIVQQRSGGQQLFVMQNTTNGAHSVNAMGNGGYLRCTTSYTTS
jgi:hypothetical protein